MVHVSLDRTEDAAQTWAAAEGFPWLTILPDDKDRSGVMEIHSPRGVPTYYMVDAEGNEVAQGSGAIFSKIEEIGK